MHDKDKIIIMSKLAVYDETYGNSDRRKNQYFRHDYIYRQNMWVRFFVLIGTIIVITFYIMHKIAIDGEDLLEMLTSGAYMQELVKIIIFIIALQVIYTLIGTVIYTISYEKAQRRLENYNRLINRLEKRKRILNGYTEIDLKDETSEKDDLDEIPKPVDPPRTPSLKTPKPSTRFNTVEELKRAAALKQKPIPRKTESSLVYQNYNQPLDDMQKK